MGWMGWDGKGGGKGLFFLAGDGFFDFGGHGFWGCWGCGGGGGGGGGGGVSSVGVGVGGRLLTDEVPSLGGWNFWLLLL